MNNLKTKKLTELGIALALATILNFIKIYELPQGGSVSLEMVPIFFIALRWGIKEGLILGSTYGVLQLLLGAKIYYPIQAVLDYPVAFSVLGLAGIINTWLRKAKIKKRIILVIIGVLLGGALRLLVHTISGVVFFSQYAPESQNVWIYSSVYNLSYMLPETIITIIIMIFLLKSSADLLERN
ncbi:energy-coupled thiamine transporter ThiT [Selenihalanaerobacter shriftii]|uniref:Thiamine transporter n=1 Tax=Selenihalanaerobacter shriftii TaxID=142842 RepID=A0A1T4LR16_9FIRM|nr:energy-coupled thiamine transporter ThiT [Selenihalanaerobacter shriftii]SJZ57091.1 thiamine transporter [Selenihalanaerobacter shriftii]